MDLLQRHDKKLVVLMCQASSCRPCKVSSTAFTAAGRWYFLTFWKCDLHGLALNVAWDDCRCLFANISALLLSIVKKPLFFWRFLGIRTMTPGWEDSSAGYACFMTHHTRYALTCCHFDIRVQVKVREGYVPKSCCVEQDLMISMQI